MTGKKRIKNRKRQTPEKPKFRPIDRLLNEIMREMKRIGLTCERLEDHRPIDIVLKGAFEIANITTFLDRIWFRVGTFYSGKTLFEFLDDGSCTCDNRKIPCEEWIDGIRASHALITHLLDRFAVKSTRASRQAHYGRWRFSQ